MYKVIVSPMYKTGTGKTEYDEVAKRMRVVKDTGIFIGHTLLLTNKKGVVVDTLTWGCVSSPEIKADYLNELLLNPPQLREPYLPNLVEWLKQSLLQKV